MRGPASSPLPSTSGSAGMEARKQDRDDALQERFNRTLKAKDVTVERTLLGRQTDTLNLATVINLLSADPHDTPERRLNIEINLRRGGTVYTAHGVYRVASSQVFPDWSPESEKVTSP